MKDTKECVEVEVARLSEVLEQICDPVSCSNPEDHHSNTFYVDSIYCLLLLSYLL